MKIEPIEKDIFFLRKTISDLKEEMDLLGMLQDMSKQLLSKFEFSQIIAILFDIIKEIINYDSCALYLYNKDSNSYKVAEVRGISENKLKRYKLDDKIIKWAFKEGRWTQVFFSENPNPKGDEFVCILPLQGVKRNLGFLLTFTDLDKNVFTPANMKLLAFVATQAGIALENQDLYLELSYSREYINNILESINGGLITIDMTDKITQINKNATAMLGLPSADILGYRYKDAFTDAVVKMIDKEKKRALRDGFTSEILFEYSLSENLIIPLGINSSMLLDGTGHRNGIIIVLRNMSTSKELERLRQLDDLKSEFVSNVSHELRTPLSIIKSYVEAALEQVDPGDYETQKEFLTVVNNETDRLSDLVSDLLDISRIEAGRFDIEMSPISISDIIQLVLPKLEILDDSHKLVVDTPSNLPRLLADKDKMVQVFINLLTNAIKFSPDGGKIFIHAEIREERLQCDFSDQGIGIPEKDIDRIFDKFYRVDISDRHEISGTGLGLPIVKHIINSHGGKISVKSEPGKGSTFSIFLPFDRG